MWQNLWKTAVILFAILHTSQAWLFVCFKGSFDNSTSVVYQNATEQISNGCLDIDKITIMLIHGYMGSIFTQGTDALIKAYLQYVDKNTVAIDYSKEANFGGIPFANYPAVAAVAYEVSREIAEMITILEEEGFDVKKLHIVGHSLGAHVGGNAGHFYTDMTNRKIQRITGLDPAQPLYDGILHIPRIDQDSADFVDIIHTDPGPGRYGMADAVGHIDFYVCPIEYDRDGRQPGCPPVNRFINPLQSTNDTCSHQRSVRLQVEAVNQNNNSQLLAAKAESVADWSSPTFVPQEVTSLGENTNQTYRGKFYLRTNGQSPFGLGVEGETPA